MSNDHAWAEFAASYAMGALDSTERDAFEAHLVSCARCRAEVQAYQEVTAALAQTATQIDAPPALRERILAEVRKVRPIAGAPSVRSARSRGSVIPWITAAAGLLAAVALGSLYIRERGARMAGDQAHATIQSELARARTELLRTDSLVAALLAPDVQSAALTAAGKPPSARLYYNRARNVVVVAAFDLPPAAAGRTYQLWGLSGGQPTSLGTFNTGADGRTVVVLPVPVGSAFEVSAITDEPVGGSPLPTTQPFLVGRWTAP